MHLENFHGIHVLFKTFIFSLLGGHPLPDPMLILFQCFREKIPPHKMYISIFNTDLKCEKNGSKHQGNERFLASFSNLQFADHVDGDLPPNV